MRPSLKESRTTLLNAANLDRKSGIRGPKTMGEAQPQPFALAIANSSTIKVEGKSSREQHERAKTYLSKHAISDLEERYSVANSISNPPAPPSTSGRVWS